MFKLANQVLDVHDDTGQVGIKKLAKINPNVYVMSGDERAELQDTDFALSVITKKASKMNKFPINSEDSTWLSNQYFEMNHQRLPKEAAQIAAYHIKKACDKFGVKATPSVVGLSKEASSNIYVENDAKMRPVGLRKTASLTELAEAEKIGENYTFAQFAFATPNHIKMACQYFEKCAEKMPLDIRHKYAGAIQRRAHELGMPAQQGTVIKYASDHYSPTVDAHIRARASLVEIADPKFSAALDKLASMKKELTPAQFAQALHGIDKRAKLDRYYGGYLTNPYEATFAREAADTWQFKTAEISLNSSQIQDVATKRYDKIKEYFGQSVADEFRKNPTQIFDSLPRDAKEIIVHFEEGSL